MMAWAAFGARCAERAAFSEWKLVRSGEGEPVPRLVAVEVLQVVRVRIELVQAGGLGLFVDVHISSEEVPAPGECLLRLELEGVVPFRGAQVADFPQSAVLRILRKKRRERNGLLVAKRSGEQRRSQVVVEGVIDRGVDRILLDNVNPWIAVVQRMRIGLIPDVVEVSKRRDDLSRQLPLEIDAEAVVAGLLCFLRISQERDASAADRRPGSLAVRER